MTLIHLRNGALSCGIAPAPGASLAYFRRGDEPVLRETPAAAIAAQDGRAFSAFPLIPFSNRIRGGMFCFADQKYTLARDAEDPRHALHGTARFMAWQVEATAPAAADFSYRHQPGPADLHWPFAYRAWQKFSLAADRLVITIGLVNEHAAPAPFGIGLHPYFVRRAKNLLRFDAGLVWNKDAEDIPVRAVPDAGKFDFIHRHEIGGGLIDNDYGGWGGRAELEYPEIGWRIGLSACACFDNLVLFTPPGQKFFAVEPVSHRPDAINPNGDPHDEGMTVLPPGGALAGTIQIILERDDIKMKRK